MATTALKKPRTIVYPTGDGKPMAETEWHRMLMIGLIDMLTYWYVDTPDVCVSGNLLMYYVPGTKRRHVSPDVFVAFGVPKRVRDYYLTWEEKKNNHPLQHGGDAAYRSSRVRNNSARFFVDRAARITLRRWITSFWLAGASASRYGRSSFSVNGCG
jgi:hypothetical protein